MFGETCFGADIKEWTSPKMTVTSRADPVLRDPLTLAACCGPTCCYVKQACTALFYPFCLCIPSWMDIWAVSLFWCCQFRYFWKTKKAYINSSSKLSNIFVFHILKTILSTRDRFVIVNFLPLWLRKSHTILLWRRRMYGFSSRFCHSQCDTCILP